MLRLVGAGSGSASDSSYSDTRSSAGGLDGAASGSKVVSWIVAAFAAISALNLAAAIALSGLSILAVGAAHLVRMVKTRHGFYCSYVVRRKQVRPHPTFVFSQA